MRSRKIISKKQLFYGYLVIVLQSLMLCLMYPFYSSSLVLLIFPFLSEQVYDYLNVTYVTYSMGMSYSSVTDFVVNFIENTMVCRHENIFRAVLRAVDKHINYFYIVTDNKHLRAYVLNRTVDLTNDAYCMNKSKLSIYKCVFYRNDKYYDYLADCYLIYSRVDVAGIPLEWVSSSERQNISKILSSINNGSCK